MKSGWLITWQSAGVWAWISRLSPRLVSPGYRLSSSSARWRCLISCVSRGETPVIHHYNCHNPYSSSFTPLKRSPPQYITALIFSASQRETQHRASRHVCVCVCMPGDGAAQPCPNMHGMKWRERFKIPKHQSDLAHMKTHNINTISNARSNKLISVPECREHPPHYKFRVISHLFPAWLPHCHGPVPLQIRNANVCTCSIMWSFTDKGTAHTAS